jgi:hypothetical protein
MVSPVFQSYIWRGWHVNEIVTLAMSFAVTLTDTPVMVASRE